VSASIAQLFSHHAQDYQAMAGQAAAFHDQLVQGLSASARSYASAEAANASLLQPGNAIARSMGAAMPNPFFGFAPGRVMHTEFIPGTTIPNPFFGLAPGQVMHTEFIPGTTIPNPFFGVPPGHWDISLLARAIT
jgi:hypothetical protein